jgi:hypothetical protein
MDGKLLKEQVRLLLSENTGSGFLDDKTTYNFCYEAAVVTSEVLQNLTTTATITTVADQVSYKLPSDFLKLYLKNTNSEFFIKYDDGSNESFLTHKKYEEVVYGNNTTSVSIPSNFSITDYPTLASIITGTASAGSDDVGGKSSLVDTGTTFLTDISVGDTVHNSTDSSNGIVVGVTSNLQVETCMFNGTDNEWDTNDSYVIVPQGRMGLVLDPPPSTSGHTITVYYLQKPVPVYSDYDTYRFQPHYINALVKYAAWLYKYRDGEPNFGDKFYMFWQEELKKSKHNYSNGIVKSGFKVSFKR